VVFDAASHFFQEIANRQPDLYREIHLLAFYYHWSESDILRLTPQKRQGYLDLLAEALTPEAGR